MEGCTLSGRRKKPKKRGKPLEGQIMGRANVNKYGRSSERRVI
jgi:hypothetical protein